ncbi:hypothetical protein KAR50_02460 [Periweissella fabaria]|uniref:Uncharacterized protein n=1 Tax=Periweissella fabaria TaxID=546157 RepID=A0ABM8Z565_9LACO|nr:SPJ_0845 family protein [Periweissella fabaria]MCM0596710.1 hypothetical protein [Periweissella fabaria]CAH0416364.1 hypothetical protein WFA24289_00668 [Periweissella fabaria]
MALTVKRETNFDKMLGDFITLPLDDADKDAKNKALGRNEQQSSSTTTDKKA